MAADENLLVLLEAIVAKQFYSEISSVTDEELENQLFKDLPPDEFHQLHDKMSQVLKSMASSDMDATQLEAFLTSQLKRRGQRITDAQANILRKFWKNHKLKIHDALIKHSTFNSALESAKWRINVPIRTGTAQSSSNSSHALLEMTLREGHTPDKVKTEIMTLEVDAGGLTKLLQVMDQIDSQLHSFCKKDFLNTGHV